MKKMETGLYLFVSLASLPVLILQGLYGLRAYVASWPVLYEHKNILTNVSIHYIVFLLHWSST